jgi:hypothetical protein
MDCLSAHGPSVQVHYATLVLLATSTAGGGSYADVSSGQAAGMRRQLPMQHREAQLAASGRLEYPDLFHSLTILQYFGALISLRPETFPTRQRRSLSRCPKGRQVN